MSHIPQNKYSKMIDDLSPSKKKEEGEKMTCQRSMTQKNIYDEK